MVEVRPRRVFANGHTYHINSISVNSDGETYLSADDLRINVWHLDITDRSFSIFVHARSDTTLLLHCSNASVLAPSAGLLATLAKRWHAVLIDVQSFTL